MLHVVICSKFITFAVTKTTILVLLTSVTLLWFAQNSLPLRWQRQPNLPALISNLVVICSKFITFAVTKTTRRVNCPKLMLLWFAQNSLPLRWQRQPPWAASPKPDSCDLLKIHYLCGDKDNFSRSHHCNGCVVICSKFITFAVTKTTLVFIIFFASLLWFAQNSLPLRWQRQLGDGERHPKSCCDLLKIHYLCGDKDNRWCPIPFA